MATATTPSNTSVFDIALDDSWDIKIVNGDFVLTTTTITSLKQRLGIYLKGYKGEYFLDTTAYIDWYGEIVNNRDKTAIDAILLAGITSQLSSTDSISSWSSTIDSSTRTYNLDFIVDTPEQTISISYNITPTDNWIYPIPDGTEPRANCSSIPTVGDDNLYEFVNLTGGLVDTFKWDASWKE